MFPVGIWLVHPFSLHLGLVCNLFLLTYIVVTWKGRVWASLNDGDDKIIHKFKFFFDKCNMHMLPDPKYLSKGAGLARLVSILIPIISLTSQPPTVQGGVANLDSCIDYNFHKYLFIFAIK